MSLRELADRRRDAVDLLIAELRIHRDREHLARDPLGHGKVALAVSQELGRLLEVDRHRAVDLSPDAALGEALAQIVAPSTGQAGRVLIEDVAAEVEGDL